MRDRAWEAGLEQRIFRIDLVTKGFDPDCKGCLLKSSPGGDKWMRAHRPECEYGKREIEKFRAIRAQVAEDKKRRSDSAKRGWAKRKQGTRCIQKSR